ncbi:Glycosyltransferase involved in cell wall bisynthesis [Succinivibrio dextrinosolvens]|uniref:glycosyltransferase family 2 protein n=1 Tax=Succinivibrio dextrinosolvens TaxID=83771 RepID=UPI0008F1D0DE|nr:glycosyltransferase family 2 protein [Succinivibrio dextrinosolvens]SFS79824.1 Glycosyltransferase involved in cell wall bisynthesis [Succinivibrio dextrinosolvens]
MYKLPLTVIILTRNEEDNIKDCIESALFADEILVLNDDSQDRTVEIAESLGAKVIKRELANDYSAQRNFGIQNAKHNWIFMLDADERITEELAHDIKICVEVNKDICYQISRENHFIQGKVLHGVLRPDNVERLFKKEGSFYEGIIHERLHSPYQKQKLKGRLIHFPYKTWEAHLEKANRYTSLLAKKYHEQGKKCSFASILLKPVWAFIKMYFIHGGFLDGKLGFEFCAAHYFYTMEKYLKLYSLNKYKGRI